MEYSTYYGTLEKINVLYYLITAHFLNYSTRCFVRNYLLGFTTTYLIIARKSMGGYLYPKKGQKRAKKGYIPYMCGINCAVLILRVKNERNSYE